MTFPKYKYISLLLAVCFALCLHSCGSAPKRVRSTGESASLSKSEFIQRYASLVSPIKVDTKGRITFFSKGKSQGATVRWHYVEHKGFSLSLRPMGLIEIARLTVTPNRIILLDRTAKEAFVSTTPQEVSDLIQDITGYDASSLSALVTNQPFSTGNSGVRALQEMKIKIERGRYCFYQTKKELDLRHYFDAQQNLIESIIAINGREIARINYSNFVKQTHGSRSYPANIDLQINWNESPIHLNVRLDKPGTITNKEIEEVVPDGYKHMGLLRVVKKVRELGL